MDNSFFLRSKTKTIDIAKIQICTWEFKNSNSLIEFGIEIKHQCLSDLDEIELDLFITWLEEGVLIQDFYNKLKESNNSRFIFNDSVTSITPLDDGQNTQGVIHKFSGKDALCILPVEIENIYMHKKVRLKIDLNAYHKKTTNENAYIRIAIEPPSGRISTNKKGIGKSTIIYDVKLNESRNIPIDLIPEFRNTHTCKIDSSFCFHIIPNSYNITFLETEHLKTVRTLEFEPFQNYLNDPRLKRDELMVIFYKKMKKKDGDSFSFFSIYTKERIGISQFALAVIVNIICAFLFAFPSMRKGIAANSSPMEIAKAIPPEFYIAFLLALILSVYFFIPLKKIKR